MTRKIRLRLLIVLVLALIILSGVAGIWANYMWFDSLGYSSVFWTLNLTRFVVGIAVFIVFFAFFQLNFWYLLRSVPPYQVYNISNYPHAVFFERFRRAALSRLGKIFFNVLSALLALMIAINLSSQWEVFQKFVYALPFGRTDPVLGKDVGFYIFKLPFYELLQSSFTSALIITLFICGLAYFLLASSEFLRGGWRIFSPVKLHLAVLIAGLFVLKAWDYYLTMYSLLISSQGTFYGAGFTDVHARIPALKILAVIAVLTAVMVVISVIRSKVMPVAASIGVLLVASLLLVGLFLLLCRSSRWNPMSLGVKRLILSII